jgi:hypothetical protein
MVLTLLLLFTHLLRLIPVEAAQAGPYLNGPVRAVCKPALDRLRYMIGCNAVTARKIGNSAG